MRTAEFVSYRETTFIIMHILWPNPNKNISHQHQRSRRVEKRLELTVYVFSCARLDYECIHNPLRVSLLISVPRLIYGGAGYK